MIVVDTSAIFAIAARENERETFIDILDNTDGAICSAVTFLETVMVLTGRSRRIATAQVEEVLRSFGVEIAPVDRSLADGAVAAFDRYGKGRHRAALNLADCFSYALAKSKDVPLLFKGNDFAQTDVASAWRR